MLKAIHIILIFSLSIVATTALAQNRKQFEDSLLIRISTTDSLELKQQLYQKLHVKFFEDHDKSLEYALKRIEIAQKIDDKQYLVSANNAIGWYLTNTIEKPDEAWPYLESALSQGREINDSAKIANALTYIGFMFQTKSYYKTAMVYYLESIPYKEQLANKRGLAFSYNLVGKVYEFQRQYDKSLEYHFKALDLRRKYVDSLQVAHSLKNIGWAYFKDGQYQNSIKAFKHCALLAEGYKHKRRMSFAYNGLGSNYLELKKSDSALYFFEKGLTLSRAVDIDFNISQALVGLGNAYFLKGGLREAENAALEAIDIVEGHRYFEQLQQANELLYKIEDQKGNATSALNYYKKFRALGDSIITSESQAQIAEMELMFNAEKKERELAELRLENNKSLSMLSEEKERQKRSLISIITLGLLLVIVGVFLRKNLIQKKELQKTVEEKNTLLREVHHRVKNSFQIVSGLLFLQASGIKNKQANKALNEVQNRVNSMVLLHQKLYQEDNLNGVNCKDYIETLVGDIVSTNSFVQHIDKRLDIAPLILDIETISPIGLIVNELVTNSLKHAFPKKIANPYIEVYIKNHNDKLRVRVTDNGIGITDSFKNTMGLSLIYDLSKKLDANVNFSSLSTVAPKGTEVIIDIRSFKLL